MAESRDFQTSTIWSCRLEGSFSAESCVVANLLRAKTGMAQAIVVSHEGVISVIRPNQDSVGIDTVLALDTRADALGLLVGAFTAQSSLIDDGDDGKVEVLDLAVIHCMQISIFTPRRSAADDLELTESSSIVLSSPIVSFAVAHCFSELEDGSKRCISYVLLRTEDGNLHVCSRKILASVFVGQNYALPTPMCFVSSLELIILTSLDYDVMALSLSDVLATESHTRRPEPRWSVILEDRVQAMVSGRFFAGSSSPDGEVALLQPHCLSFLDARTGTIVCEELFIDTLCLHMAPCWASFGTEHAQNRRRTRRYPAILSLLVLDDANIVSVMAQGACAWKASVISDVPLCALFTASGLSHQRIPVSPPTIIGKHGLFMTLTPTGELSLNVFSTWSESHNRPALEPLIPTKTALTREMVEEAKKQATLLKRDHEAAEKEAERALPVIVPSITRIRWDGDVLCTDLQVHIETHGQESINGTLGVTCFGNTDDLLWCVKDYLQMSSTDRPLGPILQVGDVKNRYDVSISLKGGSSARQTASIRLGIPRGASFFIRDLTFVLTYTRGKTMVSLAQNVTLPLFSGCLLHCSEERLSGAISIRVLLGKQPEVLYKLLSEKTISTKLIEEMQKCSPNGVFLTDLSGLTAELRYEAPELLVTATSPELISTALDFLLTYEESLNIQRLEYDRKNLIRLVSRALEETKGAEATLLKALERLEAISRLLDRIVTHTLDALSNCLDSDTIQISLTPIEHECTTLGVTTEVLKELERILTDSPSVCGLVAPLAAPNVGDRLDALLAHYGLLLTHIQHLTTQKTHAHERLRGCMAGLSVLLAHTTKVSDWVLALSVWRPLLTEFETTSHLITILSTLSGCASQSIEEVVEALFDAPLPE
ncbi:BBSome complex subunit PTHB1 [Giardia muris]|uniref:BBSome complex subunit PTHB1 n=1 Tax=Giardia muris TaxID=5742 RepID=A0A4Z1SYE8_GIAMU|nr:BBSome complex subunit PTHB1 [Giardia muris]|eukprot:TNJ28528.1 BBSome complex subunit PTHB1 [Giardia muris]